MSKWIGLITATFVMAGIAFLPVLAQQAAGLETIAAPEGLMAFISILPIVLILVLLFLKVDMLLSGLIGGALAMIIGGVSLAQASGELLTAVPKMLSTTVPIINSAIAMAVFKSGGYSAALALVRRKIGKRVEYFAAFIVLLMAVATYMSGVGGGTAMVLAPLAFAAVGAIPELIAAMCLAAAVAFTTSPASLESSIISQLTGVNTAEYVATMRPLWILFTIIAILIGFWGTKRRKAIFTGEESEEMKLKSNAELLKNTVPAIFLLFAVIAGPFINKAVGQPVLGPLMYLVITIALIVLCTNLSINEATKALIDGSSYILTRLLQVGIFIAFINIISLTGAFTAIVNLAKLAPAGLLVPALVVAGYAIGVPAGAYVATILTLILPIAHSLGVPIMGIGLITIGVGLGSQMSFVNITMQAQSSGFQIPILQVVKGNSKWILSALALLVIISAVIA